MESPEVPGSPVDYEDDVSYPCKGCGLILEEGKAFELAGNRWHIDCFRCNTCGTLLDSDANLLLLADGSLICNQCTYSCTACGNKIEDLAILTGDQAFCAGCFRCRNCKRKIENLRYARTSQGIFCMSCHESLMARRKKKQRAVKQTPANQTVSPMLALDKSLPALPPNDDEDDDDTSAPRPSISEPSTELSPRPARPSLNRSPVSSVTPKQSTRGTELSPNYQTTTETTPRMPRPYNSNRHSQISHHSDLSDLISQHDGSDPYSSFIPLVLDPSPGHTPLSHGSYRLEIARDTNSGSPGKRPLPLRTHSNTSDTPSYYETDKYENFGRKPVPNSVPQVPAPTSHIAYQEKGRQPTQADQNQERAGQEKKRPTVNTDASTFPSRVSSRSVASDASLTPTKQPADNFKLGEVPRERKRSFTSSSRAPNLDDIPISFSPVQSNSSYFANPQQKDASKFASTPPAQSPDQSVYTVSDSSSPENFIAELPDNEVPRRDQSKLSTDSKQSGPGLLIGRNLSFRHSTHVLPSHKPSYLDSLTLGDSPVVLPHPLKTPVSDFSTDEDIARILGQETSPSLLRKVSNAVRHGRSFSDLAGRIRTSPKWPRSSNPAGYYGPQYSGCEITSPIVSTESKEEATLLKNELRRSTLKIAELEMKLNNESASTVEQNLIDEQKSAVAGLESKRVTRLKELEVLFKGSGGIRTDWNTFRADALRSLATELEDLRKSYEAQIQALIAQKNQLLEETASLTRLRDQAIQESEQLNMKNAQLADLNNELTRQIQGKFQQHKGTITAPNGLGIFKQDGTDLVDTSKNQSMSAAGMHQNGQQDNDDERVIIAQPTVINVRSKGFPKKSVWKKGGAAIIKGAGKGFNKVFSSDTQNIDGTSTHADSSSMLSSNSDSPFLPRTGTASDKDYSNNHGGFDKIFGTQKFRINKKNGGSTNYTTAFTATNGSEVLAKDSNHPEGYVPLFGNELEARALYEGKSIPYVVSRCIQEVEARGMDFEGIYRKSGGASSMRMIQEAFEKGEELDLGENVDICGVTSVLKQYLRKLPTPIITPAIYDDFLKSTKFVNDEQRIEELKQVMGKLSIVHRDVLGYLTFHLKKVSEHESQNLMNSRNLAVVFAPTLMWHKDSDREMTDMHDKNNAIQFMIDHGESIFFS